MDTTSTSDPMFTIDPDELIGRTFLTETTENGERFRAHVTRKIIDDGAREDPSYDNVRFLLKVDGERADRIVGYNQLIDEMERHVTDDLQDDGEQIWRFRRIIGHQGPMKKDDSRYLGSPYNVQVVWETGEITYEPLNTVAQDNPVTCAVYARENDLLNTPGWKRFKQQAKREKRMLREINQSKLRQVRRSTKYKFGFEIPRDYQEAVRIDTDNANTKFQDATVLELFQIDEFKTFHDQGRAKYNPQGKVTNGPLGYQKIRVHLIFDVKHDGRHKARLVVDGHLTETPAESVYSSVVSLRSLRLVTFLAVHNQLELWGADIGNAYLEAETKEKLYIVAGEEFGDRQGHILIIRRALYGAKSSGKRWHERFSDVLRSEGFVPSKADTDVWMRKCQDESCYEYVAVYVDDLLIAMKDPKAFCDILKDKHKFKLKGDGPIDYHLGLNYYKDKDGTLCQKPIQYIEKMMATYQTLFKETPKKASSPLEKNDHPEVDESELVGQEDAKIYLTMIGQLQWLVTLGRFDIFSAVITMSKFRLAPKTGHMDRIKRIFGYVLGTKDAGIRVRTEEPDYSSFPDQVFDWSYSVYGDVEEGIPHDIPDPLGKPVVLTTYVDANLYHDLVSGRALTAVLHLINQTPFDWYSKQQATVETATFGSEFIAAKTAVDQVIDIRTTLRYLGVPIKGKTYMFGDNQSVVTNATLPHSKLNKRHNALSYHRVREAVACNGLLGFYHIPGDKNPADILSKHWGFQQVWPQLKTLLLWAGETKDIPDTVVPKR
jgi:hypothetical protein